MKRLFSAYCFALLVSVAPCGYAQDTKEQEEGDLLKKLEGLLDGAKDLKLLEERRLLQDLDLKELSNPEEVMKQAKAKLQELQAEGVIPIEAIRKAVEGGLAGDDEEKGATTGVLGDAPPKGVKKAAEEETDWLTIENSNSSVGDMEEGVLVFDGDVMVTNKGIDNQEPMMLFCDRLIAKLVDVEDEKGNKEKKLSSATATGRMVVINGTNADGEPVEARCQEAIFKGDDKVILRKWPEMSMQGRLIKAKDKNAKIEFSMDSGKIKQIGSFQISLKKKPETE